MGRDGAMVGANDVKFGEKRRFGKLAVVDKKGKGAEGRKRRGGEGGEQKLRYCHRHQFLPEFLCFVLGFDEG